MLSALIEAGVGGLVSSLGDWLGKIGLGKSSSQSISKQAGSMAGSLMDDFADKSLGMQQYGFQNFANSAAGYTGNAAEAMAKLKFGGVAPSVSDILKANKIQEEADLAKQNVGLQYDLARANQQRQMGEALNKATQIAANTGSSPAALAALAKTYGDAASQGASSLLGGATNAYNQASQMSSQAAAQASDLLRASRQQALAEANPYAVNRMGASTAGLSQALSTGASVGQSQAMSNMENAAFTNPLAGFANMLGVMGGQDAQMGAMKALLPQIQTAQEMYNNYMNRNQMGDGTYFLPGLGGTTGNDSILNIFSGLFGKGG